MAAEACAALASGGLDSAVLISELASGGTVHPIYVRSGLAWENEELEALRKFLGRLRRRSVREPRVLELPMGDVYGDAWYVSGRGVPGYHVGDQAWEIPGRNFLLLAKAAVWCSLNGVRRLAIGTLASNPFRDATPEFVKRMEAALAAGLGSPLEVLRPFAALHKADVVRRGRGLPLELTLSCARPEGGLHCGTCGKCRERIEAFRDAGVEDPTRYAARISTDEPA
jgi:7-cyano-7-deazaguanine synthase